MSSLGILVKLNTQADICNSSLENILFAIRFIFILIPLKLFV